MDSYFDPFFIILGLIFAAVFVLPVLLSYLTERSEKNKPKDTGHNKQRDTLYEKPQKLTNDTMKDLYDTHLVHLEHNRKTYARTPENAFIKERQKTAFDTL